MSLHGLPLPIVRIKRLPYSSQENFFLPDIGTFSKKHLISPNNPLSASHYVFSVKPMSDNSFSPKIYADSTLALKTLV
jgi:hypothetical protein